jgi:NAD(P)H-dependent flavin oxidoreductase YrpB (nitropropane dioxygenase family)
MRSAAAKANDAGLQSVWAGQGLRMLRRGSAASIVDQIRQEIAETLAKMQDQVPVSVR